MSRALRAGDPLMARKTVTKHNTKLNPLITPPPRCRVTKTINTSHLCAATPQAAADSWPPGLICRNLVPDERMCDATVKWIKKMRMRVFLFVSNHVLFFKQNLRPQLHVCHLLRKPWVRKHQPLPFHMKPRSYVHIE